MLEPVSQLSESFIRISRYKRDFAKIIGSSTSREDIMGGALKFQAEFPEFPIISSEMRIGEIHLSLQNDYMRSCLLNVVLVYCIVYLTNVFS